MQIKEDSVFLESIAKDITAIKQKLEGSDSPNPFALEWQPRKEVMKFLGYGSTQMISFERKSGLLLSKIGKRIFVNVKSLQSILEKSSSARK